MTKSLRDFLAVLMCFCMVCSLCGVGFASELPVSDGGDYELTPDTEVVPFIPDDVLFVSLDETYAIDPYSLAPVTPSGSTGLKSILLSILGNYDPIVAQYQYSNGSNYSYIREIQPDYVWLSSAAIFAILLYCTWRFLGGIVCRT